jgi:hypothetical protein
VLPLAQLLVRRPRWLPLLQVHAFNMMHDSNSSGSNPHKIGLGLAKAQQYSLGVLANYQSTQPATTL